VQPRNISRISEALAKISGVTPEIAAEVAIALCQSEDDVDRGGTLTLTGNHPSVDRGYSTYGSDNNLLPTPPVKPPVISQAVLQVDNASNGLSSRRGDNGYAINVDDGIVRNAGESWLLKHAYVQSVGTVEDSRADELTTSDPTYWVADCLECEEKGRNLSNVPVRVFYDSQLTRPDVGTVTRYMRDTNGLAWGFNSIVSSYVGSTYISGTVVRWAKATAEWTWDSIDAVGQAVCVDVDDIYGNNPGATTARVYIRATSGQDPNVQTDDIIGWMADTTDTRVCVSGGWDDKIGTIKILEPGKSVPGGWVEYTALSCKFPVGASATVTEYNEGSSGGSHPIRPKAHSNSEPSTSTSIINTDWTGDWYDTAWMLDDITLNVPTTTNTTGINTTNVVIVAINTSTTHITLGSSSVSNVNVVVPIIMAAATPSINGAVVTINDYSGNSGATAPTLTGDIDIEDSGTLSVSGTITIDPTTITPVLTGEGTVALTGLDIYGSIVVNNTDIVVRVTATCSTTVVSVSVGDHAAHDHDWSDNVEHDVLVTTGTPLPANTEAIDIGKFTDEFSAVGYTHYVSVVAHTHSVICHSTVVPNPHSHEVTDTLGISPQQHTHTFTDTFAVSSFSHYHTGSASLTAASHDHNVTDTLAVSSHVHTINHGHTSATHTHTQATHSHSAGGATSISIAHTHAVIDPGHTHVADSHQHTIYDPGHKHQVVTTLAITGSLYHATEDYRPPFLALKFIKRVGPGGT